jgi:hypothetical protein
MLVVHLVSAGQRRDDTKQGNKDRHDGKVADDAGRSWSVRREA